MTTTADSNPITDAEQTILEAQRKGQSLEAERIAIQARIHAAAAELGQTQENIITRERTYTATDQRELPKLRFKRTELTLMREDLNRLLPQIEAEVRAAAHDAQAGHRVLFVQRFNTIALRQMEITKAMADALQQFEASLRECLGEKRDLAKQQLDIQHQMGLTASIPDPEQLAKLFHRDIASVVAGGPVSPDYNAERMDWTTRVMTSQGELRARG